MMNFQLFLDEAGDFQDAETGKDISLLGGFCCQIGSINRSFLFKLLEDAYRENDIPPPPDKRYHARDYVEMYRKSFPGMLQTVMRRVWEDGGYIVSMQNRGRGIIVNDNLTYVYLAAECVVRVLLRLVRRHGHDIRLSVVFARRPGTTLDDYSRHIREHLAVEMFRLGISKRRDDVSITIGDALKSPFLMVADHICFGIRGGTAWKGSPSFKEELDPHLLDEVVIEDGQSLSLRWKLQEGNYADAIIEALGILSQGQSPLEGDARRALLQEIVPALQGMPPQYQEYQFRRLFDNLDVRTNLLWELTQGHRLLAALDEYILSPFRHQQQQQKKEKEEEEDAWIDFRFHQLSFGLANHQGDAGVAQDHLDKALKLAPDVVRRWETLPLWFGLKVDEAVFRTDACDYSGAIELLDRLEKMVKSMLEGLLKEVAKDTEEEVLTAGIRADILGKIYGTRLQARFLSGRRFPDHYEQARKDSELALKLFTNPQDLARQCLYRCHLETETGDFQEALRFLGRTLGIEEVMQPDAIVEAIASSLAEKPGGPFPLRHFCRLWAAAIAQEPEGGIARSMTAAWPRLESQCQPDKDYDHPWEVVDWKAGVALWKTGQKGKGTTRLKRATQHCLEQAVRPPRYTIGLACLAEWAALEDGNEQSQVLNRLRKKVTAMLYDPRRQFLPSLKEYFEPWDEVVLKTLQPDEIDLMRLSRDVAY